MELRHLRYFVAVAEELHFTRAAERLRISPPALTEQIQGLERDVGVRLLSRTKRSVALTDAGSRFLDEARATIRQADRAELVARLAGRGEVGKIEIGYVSSASCTGLLAQAITHYRGTHPMVSINVHKVETARQLDQLVEGRLDVAFLRPPARYPVGIASFVIARQGMMVALPAAHPLAKGDKPIKISALADEPFIAPTFEVEIGIYQHTAELGRRGKFVPHIVARAPDFFTIVTMVAAGFGIAAVPQSCACIRISGVVYRALAPDLRPAELAVAFRRDERAPVIRSLIQQLRSRSLG